MIDLTRIKQLAQFVTGKPITDKDGEVIAEKDKNKER